jgi:DNA/RNA-binding domain of Phe-tRNA-synthetase-like protein
MLWFVGTCGSKGVDAEMFTVTEVWKATYPGAVAGFLAIGHVANLEHVPALDQRKDQLEEQIRARFTTVEELRALDRLRVYHAYYKRFKKTFHIQMQLESIAFRGKSIPRVAALVEAMFTAELKNQLLTSGHDLDVVRLPASMDIAEGTERFVRINGQEQYLKAGDMVLRDTQGVIASVIYGPDERTQIVPGTQRVLFVVYAPPGIGQEAVRQHLQDIEAYVRLITPEAVTERFQVYGTD